MIYTIYNIIYGSVSPGSRVQLQFASLNLESHPDCGYDRLGQSEDIPRFPATFLYIQLYIVTLIVILHGDQLFNFLKATLN